jgi:hypothetical protein
MLQRNKATNAGPCCSGSGRLEAENLSGNGTTSDTMPDYLASAPVPEPRSVIHTESVVDPEGGFTKRSGLAMARKSSRSMSLRRRPGAQGDFLSGCMSATVD